MSENWQQSEICIVINDKSQQDNTAEHLSYDVLLHYKFVNHCAGKEFLISVNIWRSYRQNG